MADKQDAIALLKADHRAVEELFEKFEGAKGDGAKQRIALEICLQLTVHAQIEEEIFYPAFKAKGDQSDDAKMYFEALEEHRAAGDLVLPDLLGTAVDSEKFSGRAKVLKELVTHHAGEEEKKMFPRAKKLLSKEELVTLGEHMATRKAELVKQLKSSR